MDPLSLVMFGLIAVLIFFMFRNGKKRQQAQQEMQNNLQPGAEVMLQSGIFATVESVDEEDNRLTVRSGTSTLVVHRNAVGQIVTPVAAIENTEIAPDDDPEFGEQIAESQEQASSPENGEDTDSAENDEENTPKA